MHAARIYEGKAKKDASNRPKPGEGRAAAVVTSVTTELMTERIFD
jgi:hypothetical protein